MMNPKETGRFIAEKRREKNMTQEQLAQRLGVSNKTVSKWENGRNMPDYSVVEQLCRELDMTVRELLEGKALSDLGEQDEDKYQFLQYKLEQTEKKLDQLASRKDWSVSFGGLGLGCALATVISYVNWQSIGWAILHGVLGWIYVIYYLIAY